MNYRKLGKHGVKVSEVGLGSWLTYGGATENDAAKACIETAYDAGINFFDTANAYARGKSEEVVGKVLSAYERSSYVLATKVFFPMGDGVNDRGLSRKHITEQCHASLKRLGTDYIDLYQCHRYDLETPLAETLSTLDDLVKQGKILYYGVSQWSAAQITDAVTMTQERGFNPVASNQPVYNALNRDLEREVMPLCGREGIGLVVYSPLAQGLLTGKYKPGAPLPEGSRAADDKQNQFLNNGNLDEKVLAKVENLLPLAERHGVSMSQLALAWCLRKPEVSSVIIGASKPAQVTDNAGASGVSLSPEEWAEMDAVLA
ncbi:MAG: aldo/keto reductase family protein [Armatimonadetes bacterium]|nr:aldo/keto reductase family protein [Armatimonadota bacterium]